MVIVKTLLSPLLFYCRCSLEPSWFLQSQEYIHRLRGLEEGLTPLDAASSAPCG